MALRNRLLAALRRGDIDRRQYTRYREWARRQVPSKARRSTLSVRVAPASGPPVPRRRPAGYRSAGRHTRCCARGCRPARDAGRARVCGWRTRGRRA